MTQAHIGTLDQPFTSKDLHDLMLDLAGKQEIAERLVISMRTGKWHARISKLRRVGGEKAREVIRSLARFVAEDLSTGGDAPRDAGSILVEDLALRGPEAISDLWDVVVSWGADRKQLEAEVESIRSCLDALGIFDDSQSAVQEWHGKASIGKSGIEVSEDLVKHERSISAGLNVSRLLAAMGHVVPGLNLEIGGKVNSRIPFQDSREKFIAALLALQMQSGGALRTCTDLSDGRAAMATMGAQDLQERWENYVRNGQKFLQRAMQSVDEQMRRAFSVYPQDQVSLMYYEQCLRALQEDRPSFAISTMSELGRFSLLPIKKAMGENYYLFAANVVMQVQLQMFEKELEKNLQERFGVDLLKTPPKPLAELAAPPPNPSCSPVPPTFLRRGPRR